MKIGAKRLAFLAIGIAILIAVGAAISSTVFLKSTPRLSGNNNTVTNSSAASHENITQAVANPKKSISVISTISAFPFVQRWTAQYNNEGQALATVQVSYIDELSAQAFRGSSLVIVGNISSTHRNISYIPVSAQAVAIVYNIPSFPDVPSGLKLDANLTSLIFNGTISEWDDKAIKDSNPNLNLPHQKIIVVHEDTNSSSLRLVRKYVSPNIIKWRYNDGSSITAAGPVELAEIVRKTPYSIGYVDFSFAIQTKMTFAAIANQHDGDYVAPSMDSIGKAIKNAIQIQKTNNNNTNNNESITTATPPFINSSKLGNGSYPIVGLYYAALIANNNNNNLSADRNATLDFVKWIIDRNGGQQTLAEVQYPPIYNYNGSLIGMEARPIITKRIDNNTTASVQKKAQVFNMLLITP